jgi:GTPase SAR1 family protein
LVTDTAYDSVDISTIIQEIVNRSGWASGQAMQFMIFDNGSTDNAGRLYYTYKQGIGSCPILTITYHTQWEHKINTVSTPAKVYGVTNASDNFKVNKVNTVGR